MARQPVVQIQCDRCKRVELQPSSPVAKTAHDFHAKFDDKEISYDDLCSHCRGTIERIWNELSEWDRELTQSLLGPAISNNQAPPVSSPPDYSPPKPHSQAAIKK